MSDLTFVTADGVNLSNEDIDNKLSEIYGNSSTFSLLNKYVSDKDDGLLAIGDKRIKSIVIFAIEVFKKWQRRRINKYALEHVANLKNETFESLYAECAILLVQTMIFAGRADGKIQGDEFYVLKKFYKLIIGKGDIRGIIDDMLTQELDLTLLKDKLYYAEESIDVYMLSALMLDNSHLLERSYLENLAATLYIQPSLQKQLDEAVQKKREAIENEDTASLVS